MLKVKDMAERLNISQQSAYKLLKTDIPAVKIGKAIRINEDVLEQYVRNKEAMYRKDVLRKGDQYESN